MKDFIQKIRIKYGGDLNCITSQQWEDELEKLVMSQRDVPIRKKLPVERSSINHHFKIGDLDGYIIVGLYENGKPAEVFLRMAKIGSTISGLLDNIGLLISLMIQYGIPLKDICEKLAYTRFEPDGYSGKTLGFAKSITDYVARWIQWRFIDGQPERSENGGAELTPGPLEAKLKVEDREAD